MFLALFVLLWFWTFEIDFTMLSRLTVNLHPRLPHTLGNPLARVTGIYYHTGQDRYFWKQSFVFLIFIFCHIVSQTKTEKSNS